MLLESGNIFLGLFPGYISVLDFGKFIELCTYTLENFLIILYIFISVIFLKVISMLI